MRREARGPPWKSRTASNPAFRSAADEGGEIAARLPLGDDDDLGQVGVALDEPAVGLFDDVDELGMGKGEFEGPHGRCRQDDVADPPQTDEKDLMESGGISLLFRLSGSMEASSMSITGMSSWIG